MMPQILAFAFGHFRSACTNAVLMASRFFLSTLPNLASSRVFVARYAFWDTPGRSISTSTVLTVVLRSTEPSLEPFELVKQEVVGSAGPREKNTFRKLLTKSPL